VPVSARSARDRRRHPHPNPGPPPGRAEQELPVLENLQVAIDASTRLVIAIGDPQPGNRNDTIVYRTSGIDQKLAGRPVTADGGYRGNPEVIIPYRKNRDGSPLPDWKEDLNAQHRTVRAQVEHTLARMKNWKILPDYRRAARTLTDAPSGIANLHNIALTW
jgi:hypothetical protein